MTKEELIAAFGELEIELRAEGFKSSEGDGRTAADIKKEMEDGA